ncbi:MAG: hypothetical protein EOO38_00200 [Cytophagaceae bacterium]|nr:MAG: hypothetical protein EOO38_00200 [Cytophagaceae bacterium]
MASDTTDAQPMNSIQVARINKDEGQDISVCVDFEDAADAARATRAAEEVAAALAYQQNARDAARIANKHCDDRLQPVIKSLQHACSKSFDEIDDADSYAPTVTITAAVLIADFQDKLAAAQQRNETLQMMLNHDKKEET